MPHTLRSSIIVVLLAGAAAACSRSDTPAGARSTSTTSTTSTPAASADVPLNLCTVMPVDVVSGVLQARIGKSVSIATPHVGGMCDYKDVDKGVPGVEVLVDFTRHGAAADAATAYRNVHEQAASMGLALVDLPGVGDEAFGSTDAPESYGVKAHRGAYMGQVNVRTHGVPSDAVRPAATELAKLTLARLPGAAQ